jgi:2-oxoglutarate dehydrogenase E1 component
MPILMHGDAAFCGQGVVYETMQLENVPDYGVGGCIHIVVNNQIGFTTNPSQSRATRYATDLGKAFNSPIFHANADDPEAVVYAFKMAAEYRHKFKSNVILDIVGYRRYGHNEVDNPFFTQPTMYANITKHKTVKDIYQAKVIAEGLCDQAHVDGVNRLVYDELESAYDSSKTFETSKEDWFDSKWKGFKSAKQLSMIRSTVSNSIEYIYN